MTAREFAQRLGKRAKRAGVQVSSDLSGKLRVYFDLLFRWNAKINLTSLSLEAPDEAIDRLLIEPLAAARQIKPTDRTLIDIGSGGGSPAIPLKLTSPTLALVLVESKVRKSDFLREALRHLETEGTVENARFEELLARPEFHESFDLLSLRAVRTEPKTLTSLQAFVRPGGRLLLFNRASSTPTSWLAPPLRLIEKAPLVADSELSVLEKLRIP